MLPLQCDTSDTNAALAGLLAGNRLNSERNRGGEQNHLRYKGKNGFKQEKND